VKQETETQINERVEISSSQKSVKSESQQLLKGRDVNWLHYAIEV